jgi:hypothetical protein
MERLTVQDLKKRIYKTLESIKTPKQ